MLITVTKTVRQITTISTIEFDMSSFEIERTSWAFELIASLSRRSQRIPFHSAEIERLSWALRLLVSSTTWREAKAAELKELDALQVHALFHEAERCIDATGWSANTKRNTSAEFRKFINRYLSADAGRTDISRRSIAFKSSRFRKATSRPLISDLLQKGGGDEVPIGILPHTDLTELQFKIGEKLANDLSSIEKACLEEVRKFKEHGEWLKSYSNSEYTSETEKSLTSLACARIPDRSRAGLESTRPEFLLKFYMGHLMSNQADAGAPPFGLISFHGLKKVYSFVRQHIPLNGPNFKMLHYPFIGDGALLLACLLILQIHTGWNASSVLSLNLDVVDKRGENFLIQGFKSRTDDHTPQVLISPQDSAAYHVINILQSRLREMKRLKFVNFKASSLWLTALFPVSSSSTTGRIFRGFSRCLDDFCRAHKIYRFSLDQIRTQVLALHSTRSGGLETARRVAGHRNAITTAHYLDQLILHRLNSAVNHEFQRRLQNSIRYVEAKLNGKPMKKPVGFLLSPVGDGSSCVDPSSPPETKWLLQGVCGADHCHIGDGCANRRILIDYSRIEEIATTKVFYERNWSLLLGENPERFKSVHFHSMLFNIGLAGAVFTSLYGPLLRQRISELKAEYEAC